MNKVRGYIFSRSFMGERVPQHVQNIVIRDYCTRKKLNLLLSGAEYAMENSHMVLEELLNELHSIDGIVLYSLFQLPKDTLHRSSIYQHIIKANKSLHFAVEDLRINSLETSYRVEQIWLLRLNIGS
jgi:sporadic carbohydrate cluster protein (TIGR04323 family)